ncbi:MAG: GxxExxY protein [Anaerolineales bacterium]
MTELLYKKLTYSVIGAAMEVHRQLGSGFLEAVYQKALAHEIRKQTIPFEEQVHLPITYKGELIGDYIADFVVDSKLIVEIKAVSRLNSAHQAQAMCYLAATGLRLALLLNFGAGSLEHRRVIK